MIKVVGHSPSGYSREHEHDLTLSDEGTPVFRSMFSTRNVEPKVVGSCHAARLMAFITWVLDQAGDQGFEATWAHGSAADWCHATGLSAAQLEGAMIRLEDLRLVVFEHGFVGGMLFMLVGAPAAAIFRSWARSPVARCFAGYRVNA